MSLISASISAFLSVIDCFSASTWASETPSGIGAVSKLSSLADASLFSSLAFASLALRLASSALRSANASLNCMVLAATKPSFICFKSARCFP